MKPVLIYLRPLDQKTGQRIDVRVADGAEASIFGTAGTAWEPAITVRPKLSIELMSPDMNGRVQAGTASFEIAVGQIMSVARATEFYWKGAAVIIHNTGALEGPTAVPDFWGYVTSSRLDLDTGRLSLTAEVSTALIDKPLLTGEFTGGGGLAGEPAKRGTLFPAGFGTVKNIQPVWFDLARNIGMIDGYANTVSIDWLGEGLSSFGARVADYATYANLAAAIDNKTIKPGQWGTCVAQGLVGLGAPPAGIITVHATFGSNRIGAVMKRILLTHAVVPVARVDTAAFDALDQLVPLPVHYWTDQQRNTKDLLEALAQSCNATPLVSFQNLVTVTRAIGGAQVGTLDRSGSVEPRVIDWQLADVDPPYYLMKARAARPASVLTDDQVLYDDTLEDVGVYDNATVYRAGNLVWLSDGSQWLYQNSTPSSGHAPPTTAAPDGNGYVQDAWWFRRQPPKTASDFKYQDGTPIEALKPRQAGADPTATNTAAAITNQGPGATAAAASIFNSFLTILQDGTLQGGGGGQVTYGGLGGGALGRLANLFFGNNLLLEGSGGAIATLNNFKTILGIASSITGQGSLATKSTVGLDADVTDGSTYKRYLAAEKTKLATMASYAAPPSDNLLSDPHFVRVGAGDFSGWPSPTAGVSYPAGAGEAGDQCLRLDAGGAIRDVSPPYDIAVAGGDTIYAAVRVFMSSDLNTSSGARNAVLSATILKPDRSAPSYPTASGQAAAPLGQWVTLSGKFTVPVGYTIFKPRISMRNDATAGYILVDWVSFSRGEKEATVGAVYGLNLLEAGNGALATLANFKTGLGTAAAIAGQGALATRGNVEWANMVAGRPASLVNLDGAGRVDSFYIGYGGGSDSIPLSQRWPQEAGANVTENRTAAAFTGQGAFATQSQIDLTSVAYFIASGRFASYNNDSRFFNADNMIYPGDGNAVSALKPRQAGADVTSGNTAAAITGQGALATRANVEWANMVAGRPASLANLDPSGRIDSYYVGYGGTTDSVPLSSRWPQEAGANVTEGRTAAAFTGQGPWATLSTSTNRVSRLQDDGYIHGSSIYLTDQSDILSKVYPAEKGANKTETRTAAAFTGQGTFATISNINRGNIASYFNYNAISLNYTVTRQDGTSIVTESLAITSLGIASAVSGQGALATKNTADTADIAANAVTNSAATKGALSDVDANTSQSNPATIATLTLNATGNRPVRIDFSVWFENPVNANGDYTGQAYIRLVRVQGGSTTDLTGWLTQADHAAYKIEIDYPGSGSVEYRIQFSVNNPGGNQGRVLIQRHQLILIELKR